MPSRRCGDDLDGDLPLIEGKLAAAGAPGDAVAAGGPLDEPDRLEPAAIVAGRLEAALAQLLGDIGDGAGFPFGPRRAALEIVAGEDLDSHGALRRGGYHPRNRRSDVAEADQPNWDGARRDFLTGQLHRVLNPLLCVGAVSSTLR